MKVLVIEDKEMHRQAARETLKDHDVTIVETFEKGIKAMSTDVDNDVFRRLAAEVGHGDYPSKPSKDEEDAWQKCHNELIERARRHPGFEAVLVDMMMPMNYTGALVREKFQPGVEVPYGFVLALRAAQIGAKYIAMVTDTNHHHSAMSSSLDYIFKEGNRKPFEINGAKCLFLHAPFITDRLKDAPCRHCKGTGVCPQCEGTGKWPADQLCLICKNPEGKCPRCKGLKRCDQIVHERKHWGNVLNYLVTGSGLYE